MIIALSSRANAFKNGKSQDSMASLFDLPLIEMSGKIVQAITLDKDGLIGC